MTESRAALRWPRRVRRGCPDFGNIPDFGTILEPRRAYASRPQVSFSSGPRFVPQFQ